MSRTDFMGRSSIMSFLMLCCALLSLNTTSLFANGETAMGTLVCDDQINVSLNEVCEGEITVQMVLEGESSIIGFDPLNYDLDIEGPNGAEMTNILTTPGLYTVTVSEVGSGPGNLQPPYNSCWGHILVEDKLPPQLVSCPCELGNTDPDCVLPILCEELGDLASINVPLPQATDNCNNQFDITFTDNVSGIDCSTTTVIRTWRLTDPDGNYVTCVSEYRIDPLALSAAILAPKQHVDLDCGLGTSPEEIYDYFANEFREDNPCGGYGHSCDPAHPDYDPDFVEAYEDAVHQYATMFAFPSLNGVILSGNICNTVTTYSDNVIPICSTAPGCEGNAKIVRTWTIYDWCDPNLIPVQFSQVIKASDNTEPSIDAESFTTSIDPWGCTATVYFPEPTHLTDNCSSYVTYAVTGSGTTDIPVFYDPNVGYYATDVPVGQHQFYYTAYDCCDNTSSEGVTVTVLDATPPVAITKQDIVVSLIPNPGDLVEPGLTKIFAENVDNGSFDGCGPVKLEIRRETESCGYTNSVTYNDDGHSFDDEYDLDEGRYVTFCCSDLDEYGVDEDNDGFMDYAQIKVWLRVWDDGDGDGYFGSDGDNFSEVWAFVRLEDKSRPTILCPADVVIDCDGDSADLSVTGEATAISSCGPVGVSYQDVERDLTSCNEGTITRRWFVDGYPDIFCDQEITLSGTIIGGPITVEFPQDTVVTCADDLYETPTWYAGTCDQMAYSLESDTFYFEEGACFKILNYWTVINWCTYNPLDPYSDGIWTDVQVVKIQDDTAPVLLSCEDATFTADANCVNDMIMLTNSAEDIGLCSSNRLVWTVEVDINNDWNVEYRYSSSAPPSSGFYIPPSSSGEEIKITLPEGIPGSMTSHRVLWRVSDGCNNFTTCTTYFMVVDEIPPTPYCVNLSTALMENGQVELWACDFDLGAFDNCTDHDDLRFTFTDVPPHLDPAYNPLTNCSAKIFTCDDIISSGGSVVTLQVYVWDEKDNYDFCSVFLTLVDNNDSCDDIGANPTAQIGGSVATEFGESIGDVEMTIVSPQPEYPSTKMTDGSGHFMFDKNFMHYDYQLQGYSNDNPLNGVSTLDLVLIQRHILGLEKLDSPFKMIAADINNDESISSLDLLELRKLVLGIYNELPENNSWRFVNPSSIINPANPWPVSEVRNIQDLSNNMMQENFTGVKIGDVNNTVTVNAKGVEVDRRKSKAIELAYEDAMFNKGELVEMTLSSKELKALSGLQFTLKTQDLELVSVAGTALDINESNFAQLDPNTITFSWNTAEMIDAQDIVTITFTAKSSGKLSERIEMNSNVVSAEAYLGTELNIVPVTLIGRNNTEQAFALEQNNPNPFKEMTTINFTLPQSSNVDINVVDVTGKLVWSMSGDFAKGANAIELSSKDINATGVLYYTIEAGAYTATKKMIIIE